MNNWKPDRILRLLVFWIVYLLVFSWLPLVRLVMDGDTYHWGTTHFGYSFSANTLSSDVWLLAFKSALLIGMLYLALRGAGPFFRALIVLWTLLLSGDVVHAFVSDPNGFEFHGDTLGIHLNLGWSVVAVVTFFALLAIYWVGLQAKPSAPGMPPAWAPHNRKLLTILFVLLPIQFVLLRFGEPHGTTDAIGVLLTIAQCPLLALALYPWPSEAAAGESV